MKSFDRIDHNPYTKAFHFEGNSIGVLLIHGFTGSPGHMLRIGESLRDDGYTVLGIQLPGHGTHLEDMEQSTWQEWLSAARDGFYQLAKTCSEVFVCGLSMGGILTLHLAEELPLTGAIPIAAPIRIFDRFAPYTPILKHIKRYRAHREKQDKHPYDVGYQATPLRKVPDLLRLMKVAEANLHKITCPLLIIQGLKDKTVKPESAQIIYDKAVACPKKELLWLEDGPHVCTLDTEYETLIGGIREFLSETLAIVSQSA